jgi:hypothetical protein
LVLPTGLALLNLPSLEHQTENSVSMSELIESLKTTINERRGIDSATKRLTARDDMLHIISCKQLFASIKSGKIWNNLIIPIEKALKHEEAANDLMLLSVATSSIDISSLHTNAMLSHERDAYSLWEEALQQALAAEYIDENDDHNFSR